MRRQAILAAGPCRIGLPAWRPVRHPVRRAAQHTDDPDQVPKTTVFDKTIGPCRGVSKCKSYTPEEDFFP